MIKSFLLVFIVLLVLVTIGMIVVFYYVHKGIRYFRRFSTGDMNDEEFQRMANKYYRKQDANGSRFDDDYFKGSGWQKKQSEEQKQEKSQSRRQTTSGGVTIEDRRDPNRANKKIFARDEGEYVDFKEN